MVCEVDQHPTGEGSEMQAIVLPDSHEMVFRGHLDLEATLSTDLGEVPLTHVEGIASKQIASQLDKATSS